MLFDLRDVEERLKSLYIAAPDTGLRKEELKKAQEVSALLAEMERILAKRGEPILLDAACGKAYAGLLAAELIFARRRQAAHVILCDREPMQLERCKDAASRLGAHGITLELRLSEVGNPDAWPEKPDLVVALHACGRATDDVIDCSIGHGAKNLLVVPCCYGHGLPGDRLWRHHGEKLGIPRHAAIRTRFAQAIIDAERTLRLEAAGYETEVVELVSQRVTPHNLLFRSRRVGEPIRSLRAQSYLERLTHGS